MIYHLPSKQGKNYTKPLCGQWGIFVQISKISPNCKKCLKKATDSINSDKDGTNTEASSKLVPLQPILSCKPEEVTDRGKEGSWHNYGIKEWELNIRKLFK